jgi:hypothetical protein
MLWHVLAWLGFFAYEQAIVVFTAGQQYNLHLVIPTYLLGIGLFYTNSDALMPQVYGRPRWGWHYALAGLALLALYAGLRCLLYLKIAPRLGIPTPGPTYSLGSYWALAFYRGTFLQLMSVGYWLARNAVRVEQQKRLQEQQLRMTERSLMEANLAFLKSQINPHFLFNSLNFLYAQVYPHSENASKGILLLAETMRYALHEDQHGKVMLSQEVKHLHNYISLNQLRFDNQLHVDFEVRGNLHFLLIIPLVLITFVENCFKHGDLADPAHALTLRLDVVQNALTFRVRNKKRHGPKEKSTGIGLVNTRQRLDLFYPERYSLDIQEDSLEYACTLIIKL